MAESSEASGEEIFRDAVRLAWEDFELPPEEILMIDGLKEKYGISDELHKKIEIEVIEGLINTKTELGLDKNIILKYYETALKFHPDWKEGRERYNALRKELGLEPVEEKEEEGKKKEAEGEKETPKSIKCPKCGGDIPVEKWEFPMRVVCPHCGAKGVLKRPPKNL